MNSHQNRIKDLTKSQFSCFYGWKLWECSVVCDQSQIVQDKSLKFSNNRLVMCLRNGVGLNCRSFNNCFSFESLTEKFKIKLHCLVVFSVSLYKNLIRLNLYTKISTNSWNKFWQENVTAKTSWRFLSFVEKLLIVQ